MTMKINPIIQNPNKNNPNLNNKSSLFVTASIAAQIPEKTDLTSKGYYLPVNFKANEAAIFSNELRDLENIHCPGCGVKMLSKKEMQNLINEGARIKSPKSFVAWLEKNKESLPEKSKHFLDSAKRNSMEYGTTNVNSLLLKMRESAFVASENAVVKMKNILTDTQVKEQLSDGDNVLLEECIIRLDEIKIEGEKDILRPVKAILQDTVVNLENKNAQSLYSKLMGTIVQPAVYQRLFPDYSGNGNYSFYQKEVLKNLFNHSFSSVSKIVTNFDNDRNIKQNLLLTCQDCRTPESSHFFKYHQNNKNLKTNFIKYLEDIGNNALNDKLKGGVDYTLGLIPFVRKITGGHIDVVVFESKTLKAVNVKKFNDNQEKVDFEPVNHSGVPCASCGDATITHKEKMEFFAEIESKKNMHELGEFLKKHDESINTRYKPMMNVFLANLEEKPTISELEMLKNLKIYAAKKIKLQLEENVRTCELKWSELKSSDKALVHEYIESIRENFIDFPDNKPFPYEEYTSLLKRTIFLVKENSFRNRYSDKFKESIRKTYTRQMILYPVKETVKKLGSPMKVIVQDVFKGSVATVDHIVAKSRQGWEKIPNYLLMCKNCNAEKSNYSVAHWADLNQNFGKNLQKYLDKIVDMIKKHELDEKYKSYPYILASCMNKLTNGRIMLRFPPLDDAKK